LEAAAVVRLEANDRTRWVDQVDKPPHSIVHPGNANTLKGASRTHFAVASPAVARAARFFLEAAAGSWSEVQVGGHPCDVYEPTTRNPHGYVVVYLHGVHQARLVDNEAFRRE